MTWAPEAALVVLLTLAAVLATSGIAKLRDQRATRDAFDALRIPGFVPADAAATALPWVELALAVLLVVAPAPLLVPVAVAVLLLMLAYTWIIARALGFEEPVTCSCFGSLGRHDVDRTTVARNVVLSLLAGGATWFALDGGSAPASFAELDGGGWATLAAAAAAALVAVLVVGGPGEPTHQAPDGGELFDYERHLIPYGVLTMPDGTSATLNELARTQARLLVVLNRGCSPCVRIAEKLDGWAEQLGPAVGVLAVYPDPGSESTTVPHAAAMSTWEPDLNVRRVLAGSTPAAVVLGADGYLAAGPASGEDAVVDLVEAVLYEIGAEPPQPSIP